MKYFLLLLFVGLQISCTEIRIGDTIARKIAKSSTIGKGQNNLCLPFAYALHNKFEQARIKSKVVCYHWQHTTDNKNGDHAIVIFDDQGRTYVMDNQSFEPTWVKTSTELDIAQQFSGVFNQVIPYH